MATVTIRDVARVARVSVKTVSRVINEEVSVHPTTRAHVQQVIRDLAFRPNPLARSLVTQRTRTIGLVVPDVSNAFFAPAIHECVDRADQKGYHLVIDTGGAVETEARHLRALLEQRVSGIILWTSALSEERIRAIMAEEHRACPMVFVDCAFTATEQPHSLWRSFQVDQHAVGLIATTHLLREGRQRVAHLAHRHSWAGRQRYAGYCEALTSQGVEPDESWIIETPHVSIQCGALATLELLARDPYPDSIFAYNDAAAVGAVLACRKKKLRVPEDIAVVGVDDTEMAAVSDPPLTTIRIFQRETGARAIALLLDLIEGEGSGAPDDYEMTRDIVVPLPELIVRHSSSLYAAPEATLEALMQVTQSNPNREATRSQLNLTQDAAGYRTNTPTARSPEQ